MIPSDWPLNPIYDRSGLITEQIFTSSVSQTHCSQSFSHSTVVTEWTICKYIPAAITGKERLPKEFGRSGSHRVRNTKYD